MDRYSLMRGCLRFAAFGLAALVAWPLWAAEVAPDFSKFAPLPLHPALITAARRHHIPLVGIDAPTNTGKLTLGDAVTAVVTFCQKDAPPTQWLLFVEAVSPGPKDTPPKPKKPAAFYASTGLKMEFASAPAWVDLHTLGPFADAAGKQKAPTAGDAHSRFTLDQGFLALGMDQAAAAVIRMTQFKEKAGLTNWALNFSPTPPPAESAQQNQKVADRLQLTAGEQRAMAGAIPAMLSYFEVVGETPHLEKLMYKVVDLPSVWSVVGHLGVKVDLDIDSKHFAPAEVEPWGVPTRPPVYYLPMVFRLNRRPGLLLSLAVTTPHPPLLACGGIVGILAEKPGEAGTYLTVRVISARFAQPGPSLPAPRGGGD